MNKKIEKAFDKFYNSKIAQDYCFGNHNRASRDEQIGEFSFEAGYKEGEKTSRYYYGTVCLVLLSIMAAMRIYG